MRIGRPLKRSTQEKTLHEAFEIGVIIKFIDGVIELIGGALLLFIAPDTLLSAILSFANGELAENPHDFFAGHLLHAVQGFSAETVFYAWLFIVHGAVKVVIATGLLKHKPWAYPAAITAFSLFVAYQLYEIVFNYSLLLVLITIIDVTVIMLTIHEYREVRKKGFAYYQKYP